MFRSFYADQPNLLRQNMGLELGYCRELNDTAEANSRTTTQRVSDGGGREYTMTASEEASVKIHRAKRGVTSGQC